MVGISVITSSTSVQLSPSTSSVSAAPHLTPPHTWSRAGGPGRLPRRCRRPRMRTRPDGRALSRTASTGARHSGRSPGDPWAPDLGDSEILAGV